MFCFHDGLREFAFSDGAVIKLCKYCTAFDNARIALFACGYVTKIKPSDQQRWDVILNQVGFSLEAGVYDWLVIDSAIQQQSLSRRKTPITYSTLDDHNFDLRQVPFYHSLPMPRTMHHFCPDCIEEVGPRKTKGCYLPVEHECPRTRVYDRNGKLLEVV